MDEEETTTSSERVEDKFFNLRLLFLEHGALPEKVPEKQQMLEEQMRQVFHKDQTNIFYLEQLIVHPGYRENFEAGKIHFGSFLEAYALASIGLTGLNGKPLPQAMDEELEMLHNLHPVEGDLLKSGQALMGNFMIATFKALDKLETEGYRIKLQLERGVSLEEAREVLAGAKSVDGLFGTNGLQRKRNLQIKEDFDDIREKAIGEKSKTNVFAFFGIGAHSILVELLSPQMLQETVALSGYDNQQSAEAGEYRLYHNSKWNQVMQTVHKDDLVKSRK